MFEITARCFGLDLVLPKMAKLSSDMRKIPLEGCARSTNGRFRSRQEHVGRSSKTTLLVALVTQEAAIVCAFRKIYVELLYDKSAEKSVVTESYVGLTLLAANLQLQVQTSSSLRSREPVQFWTFPHTSIIARTQSGRSQSIACHQETISVGRYSH